MKKWFAVRLIVCILIAGAALYVDIDHQNQLTELRLTIPLLQKELRGLEEQNNQLQYEIDQFESPIRLLDLLKKPEFAHLKFPYTQDIIEIPTKEDRP